MYTWKMHPLNFMLYIKLCQNKRSKQVHVQLDLDVLVFKVMAIGYYLIVCIKNYNFFRSSLSHTTKAIAIMS